MTRPAGRVSRSEALNRAAVAEAAVAMVAEAGFDELTVRGVARRLSVSAPSLYEYVSSKDDLIDLVVAQVLERAEADWAPPSDWQDLLRYAALWWHQVLREHEAVYRSVLRRPMAARVAVDTVDRVLVGLIAAGFSAREAVDVYGQFFNFVLGATALVRTRTIARAQNEVTAAEARRTTELLLDGLDAEQYSGIAAGREDLARLASDQMVSDGLEAFIEGLRCRLAVRVRA